MITRRLSGVRDACKKACDDRSDLLGSFEHHQMAAPGNHDQLGVREETRQDARVDQRNRRIIVSAQHQ
jgi:hypothetical protein